MPYPPESSWNDPPTDAQVRAIIRAGNILHIDITERDIPPTRWQARDLQTHLWDRVRGKGKKISGTIKEANMQTKVSGICHNCGYPITANPGEQIRCPMCGTVNQAISQGVTIPSWLLTLGIGLAVGIFAGPVILASTESGSRYLERRVREKLG
jgi:hypothetical protein